MYLRSHKNECEFEEPRRTEILKQIPEDIRMVAEKHTSVPTITATVDYGIAYWRKFNALHGWIVKHCADGVDECQEIEVPREDLRQLYGIALEILLVKKTMSDEDFQAKANELLPATSGFFFGSDKYDEWYLDGVKRLAEVTKDICELLEKPGHEHDQVIYQASW